MKSVEYLYADASVADHLCDGFIAAYKEAFRGPPYYETYTDDEVLRNVWLPHLTEGIMVVARAESTVIGFGCAKPLAASPADIQEFLHEKRREGTFPVDLATTWYMSELGVLPAHRGRGIAYRLVERRLVRISKRGGASYVMRTAADGSNSIRLYRNIGAIELTGRQDVSGSAQVLVNKSQSAERVYLFGSCAEAIRRIAARVPSTERS